jgi:glycosyltransferase involved in cell wall biosynthesis
MLIILTTHPIQYQAPLWKELASRKNVPFKVLYMSDQGLNDRFDPGFGQSLSWDIDLLGGYECEFLDTYRGARWDSFWGLRLKNGFGRALRDMGADVLWIQGWQVLAYWQAVFEARRAGIEVWLRGETNAGSDASRIRRQFKVLLRRGLLHRIDWLLYIGQANRQFYLREGIDEKRLAPAPYCVDNHRFAAAAAVAGPERRRFRQEWGIPAEAFCFVFVGKFITKKRPFDLVEAARRLQDERQGKKIHLLWVGTGELGEELRQVCHVCYDAGITRSSVLDECHKPNASFVGFLNQSEISRAYAAADCLVLPSDANETWGLVVNEAMASGIPCIVSSACGCTEDLVEPIRPDLSYRVRDIGALERAMVAVITRTPSAELLQAHISKYDVGRTIDTVENLYFKTLKHAASKSDPVLNQ